MARDPGDDESPITPVEGRLQELVAGRLGTVAPEALAVRTARYSGKAQAPGDFRLLASSAGVEDCAALAAALAEHPDVEAAVAVPPNVYLSLTPGALGDLTASAVLADPSAYGRTQRRAGRHMLICYSNPNLNKPLHIGHLRNNVVAMAISNLLEEQGADVFRCEIGSDWGRHICQSIVGWLHSGEPEPALTGGAVKPDHMVGRYYARFHEENDRQRAQLASDTEMTALEAEVAELLKAMEAGDESALDVNRKITSWAAEGLRQTYDRIGSRFEVSMRESQHMDRSQRLVEEGLAKGVFQRREDGAVVIDLADEGLDEIVLARGDGTLVIYAQTLGVDIARYELGDFTDLLTVNGDQWKDGHKIIDTILCRLGHAWAADIERIYYGMVHTTAGVMSSRRGQAILIDRLLDETEAALAKRRAGSGGDEADIPALTLGVVKHALLRAPYAKTFTFDPDGLFAEPYDEYLAMLAGIRPDLAPSPPPARPGSARGREKSARLAMLDLAAFPTLVDKAAADRDPTRLSRFLRSVTAELAAAEGMLDEPVVRAAGTVLRRGLGILNIDTPEAYA